MIGRRLWPLHAYALAALADTLSAYAGFLLLAPGVEVYIPFIAGHPFTPAHAAYELALFGILLLAQMHGPVVEERLMQRGHRLPAGLLGRVRRAALEALTLGRLVSALQNLYILARFGAWP